MLAVLFIIRHDVERKATVNSGVCRLCKDKQWDVYGKLEPSLWSGALDQLLAKLTRSPAARQCFSPRIRLRGECFSHRNSVKLVFNPFHLSGPLQPGVFS